MTEPSPLRVRNLSIWSSHCQFVTDGAGLQVGDVQRVVNDNGYSRRVRVLAVQNSGPAHRRTAFVVAKLIDQRSGSGRMPAVESKPGDGGR
jgi:hypothetical protein